MKYIVLKRKNLFIPVVLPEFASHSDFVPKDDDVKVDSAGFFGVIDGEVNVVSLGSESLNVEPNIERDTLLLTLLLSGYPMSFFLDFDSLD